MLKKLANFIVDKRILITTVMLALVVAGVICMQFVVINEDMTEYLPDNSNMKTGMAVMEEEFPEQTLPGTIRVMIDDLDDNQKTDIPNKLSAIEYVDSVSYLPDSSDYNKGNHTLYVLNISCGYGGAEEEAINSALETQFADYQIVWQNDDVSYSEIPVRVLVVVMIVLLIILFVMCSSWIEPFLFLIAIGIAVAINSGTNLLLGSVASITNSIVAILQMVLSMDYSIILMNRYRQERALEPDKYRAMKNALANAFSSVAASSLTTVVGLLMLIFMSFKIGADLGVVLAKGVFISMVCVLTILPAMILACDNILIKTAKKSLHIPMDWAARFSYKLRYVLTALFAVLFIGVFILQQQTGISYAILKNDPIADVFPQNNMTVFLYENKDEDKMTELYDALDRDEHVKSVSGYRSLFVEAHTAEEIASLMGGMGGGASLDPSVLHMLYYTYFTDGKTGTMTLSDFFTFVMGNIMNNKTFAKYIDRNMMTQALAAMDKLMEEMALGKEYTAQEMGELLSGMIDGFDPDVMELLYLYKDSLEKADPAWALTLEEMYRYIVEDFLNDPRFSPMIDDETKQTIISSQTALDDGKAQLRGENFSRLIITTSYPDEGAETEAFMKMLTDYREKLNGKSYLIGNAAMTHEMQQSFDGEYLMITLLTALAIFLIVALTFRSVTIPVILVLLVQCSIFITITVTGVISGSMYYLALLIVECILMGATIDYGILFTNYYCESRRTLDVRDALKKAYAGSTHTIMTSGLILVAVTAIAAGFYDDETVTAIIQTISIGSFSAIVLILFLLPGILVALDRIIIRKRFRVKQSENSEKD